MISKISKIIGKKDSISLQIIFAINFITFFFEFLSLLLIPLFVSFILDIERVLEKFEDFGFYYLLDTNHQDLIKYLGFFIIFVFVLKNLFYYSLVHIQGKFEKKVRFKLSTKLLRFYVSRPFFYHLENNPAILTRNTTNSIDGFGVFLNRIVELFKEILTLIVIFILLSFVNIKITVAIFFIFLIFGYFYLKVIRPNYKDKAKVNENYKINLIQIINETFGAIKDIKILNKENDVIEHYNENRDKFENNLFYFFVLQKIPRLLLETLAIIFIVIASFFIISIINKK